MKAMHLAMQTHPKETAGKAGKGARAASPAATPGFTTRALDITLEQHPGGFKLVAPAAGDRHMDIQVGWLPPQWTPENHMLLTMKSRVVVTRDGVGFPLCVAEVTTLSESAGMLAPESDGTSQGVVSAAEQVWPEIRALLTALLALGQQQPELPQALPLREEVQA